MQTLEMGKKLSTDFKLSMRTAPRLYEAFSHLLLKAVSAGLKFNGRKIGAEAVLNAILIDFLEKSKDDQLAIVRKNVLRFEGELAGTGEGIQSPVVHMDTPVTGGPFLEPAPKSRTIPTKPKPASETGRKKA